MLAVIPNDQALWKRRGRWILTACRTARDGEQVERRHSVHRILRVERTAEISPLGIVATRDEEIHVVKITGEDRSPTDAPLLHGPVLITNIKAAHDSSRRELTTLCRGG